MFTITFSNLLAADYDIPGEFVSEDKCHVYYNRSRNMEGTFNSPRNPFNYPHNITCTYDFFGRPGDHLRITFETFKITGNNRCDLCGKGRGRLRKMSSAQCER